MSKLDLWTDFPADLAAAHNAELENYRSYASTASNVTSEDALGIYVEHEHDFVHGYIADLYDTPGFGGFDPCMYFMFYQWHGMVDDGHGNCRGSVQHRGGSQLESTATDYRYAGRIGASLTMKAEALPVTIERQCFDLARGLGLRLAGIDLRLDPEGRWWCFEVNTAPGFTWFEDHTGLPISTRTADALTGNRDAAG